MTRIDEIIDSWCHTIGEELSQRTFFDKDEVKAYAKVRLKEAVRDCIDSQRNDLESERLLLVEEYTRPGIPTYRQIQLQKEIAAINIKIKERSKAYGELNQWSAEDKLKYATEKNVVKIVNKGTRKVVGRLVEIHHPEQFKNSITRTFILALHVNRNSPGKNESNFVCFTLKQDSCFEIDKYTVGELITVEYRINGGSFAGRNGTVYTTTLNVTSMSSDIEDEVIILANDTATTNKTS